MIPDHSHEGILPPFLPGGTPTEPGHTAPYRADLSEVVQRYGNSAERREILKGLLSYRKALREAGISQGFQWLDGSFVEDCENNRGRSPADIDIITFSVRPKELAESNAWRDFVLSRPDLFDAEISKDLYKCDAYFVDMGVHPVHLVAQTRYWFGLFSHQRDTYLWKGMIEVPFIGDDKDVKLLLDAEVQNAS